MTSIIVTPKVINEIEFYVAPTGETGVSIGGLARLSGVARQTVSRLLNSENTDAAYNLPKWLEGLQGNIFYPQLEGSKGQRIVREDVAVLVIEYYAFESKSKNYIAVNSIRNFARKGFSQWVKEITEQADDSSKMLEVMQQLIGEVQNLSAKTEALTTEVGEYRQIRKTTVTLFPGMNQCLDMFANDKALPPEETAITLADWLANKGVTLSKSNIHKFANLVAETYRTMSGQEPKREMVAASNGRGASLRNVYTSSEFPILEVALKRLF